MESTKLNFYSARDGAPRAEGFDEAGRVLALFLESDLQDDPGLCREVLYLLSGHGESFIGNAFAVSLEHGAVRLEGNTEGNDRRAVVHPDRLEKAVIDWLAFLSNRPGGGR